MDSEFVKGLPSLLSSTISLIILLIALFLRVSGGTKEPLDSPNLKVLVIKRYPISQSNYPGRFSLFSWQTLLLILSIAGNLVTINLILSTGFNFLSIFTLVTSLIIYTSLTFTSISEKEKVDVNNIIYDYFKKADIVVEADRHYLFNKCHEALRSMKLRIDEVDAGAGSIIASYIPFTGGKVRRIEVKIEFVERSESSYMVTIEFKSKTSISKSSKITNRFINRLLRNPNSRGENSNSWVNISPGE